MGDLTIGSLMGLLGPAGVLAVGGIFIAWRDRVREAASKDDLHALADRVLKIETEGKSTGRTLDQIGARLDRIEGKMDTLLSRGGE